MNEDRLRQLLRDHPVPGSREAEERAWRVLRIAFEQRQREPEPTQRRLRVALAIAAALLLAALLALTPAGAKVGDLIGDVLDPGRKRAEPVLTDLPTGGRLLVESRQGPWIVQRDGAKRLLGEYAQARWSPRGRFVAATRKHELLAVDPLGEVRWSVTQRRRIASPTWSPSGFRVAYLSGDSVRVVAGDGTEDRLVDAGAAATAPVWKPGQRHLLAYVDRSGGRVRLVDVDSGREVWASAKYGVGIVGLDWSPDGRQLIVLTSSFFSVLDERGRPIAKGSTRGFADLAAFSPDGDRIALVRTVANAKAGRSELVLIDRRTLAERRVFAGPGRFTDVTWSPDGEWLLLSWRDADQWLFIRPGDERVVAVSNISRQFAPGESSSEPFPRVSGWCCPP